MVAARSDNYPLDSCSTVAQFQEKIMSKEVCLLLYFILLLSTPVKLRACTRALDVVFVLNSGLDIPDDDWNVIINLSRDVGYRLRPGTYGSHVAQVQFGGNASVVYGLDTKLQVIRDRSFETGRNISNAIDTTRRLVLNNMGGDRPDVPDVIVLITHGLADDKNSAITEAARVKSEGIRIITVGMTNIQVDHLREELREIATDPGDVDNLMLISRNYYTTVYSYLVQTICRNRIEAANESVRLVDGTSNTGRLEIYINEEWVTVCSSIWTNLNTRLACKQLGFPGGRSMYTVNQTSYHRRIGVSNIQCTGDETTLLQCSHDPFFHIDASCDHKRDVFLRCVCDDCDDYIPRDNVRLADGTSISGRLEIFSPGLGWGGVCSSDWTTSNTRVACRQLGFLDEAGAYQPNHRQSITLVSFRVSCSGNENSLFDCRHTTVSSKNCNDPIYIRCECNDCLEVLLQAPLQKNAITQSSEAFEWHFKHNISSFEILFLSQKNPQTLIYVERGNIVKGNTRFKDRIQLMNDDYATIGFNLTNITTADMGIYALHVPKLLLDSKAILVVTDFAVVPDPVVHRKVYDSVVLSWDLTALRQLREINHDILLTTPASGLVHLDYYYKQWLPDNPRRHSVPETTDHLHTTIIIDNVTVKDAGKYIIEVTLTSSVYKCLNSSWQFAADLVVVDTANPYQTCNLLIDLLIAFGVLLGLSIFAIIGLACACQKHNKKIHELRRFRTVGNNRPTQEMDRDRQVRLQREAMANRSENTRTSRPRTETHHQVSPEWDEGYNHLQDDELYDGDGHKSYEDLSDDDVEQPLHDNDRNSAVDRLSTLGLLSHVCQRNTAAVVSRCRCRHCRRGCHRRGFSRLNS